MRAPRHVRWQLLMRAKIESWLARVWSEGDEHVRSLTERRAARRSLARIESPGNAAVSSNSHVKARQRNGSVVDHCEDDGPCYGLRSARGPVVELVLIEALRPENSGNECKSTEERKRHFSNPFHLHALKAEQAGCPRPSPRVITAARVRLTVSVGAADKSRHSARCCGFVMTSLRGGVGPWWGRVAGLLPRPSERHPAPRSRASPRRAARSSSYPYRGE
jgi:hypothetical protein